VNWIVPVGIFVLAAVIGPPIEKIKLLRPSN
jgi:hypothetical protein